jgi:hypothetical protein
VARSSVCVWMGVAVWREALLVSFSLLWIRASTAGVGILATLVEGDCPSGSSGVELLLVGVRQPSSSGSGSGSGCDSGVTKHEFVDVSIGFAVD